MRDRLQLERPYQTILIFTLSIACVFFLPNAYASTISDYCFTGTCHTPNTLSPINIGDAVYIHLQHKIGIQLSQSCVAMEMHQVKSNCLTYDKLKHFDNSNPLLGGLWINDTWYHRLNAHVKNAYHFYDSKDYLVMVDPDASFTVNAKMIIVGDTNYTYINPNQVVGDNHTRTEYSGRYVSNCSEAQVSPNISLINDTITYLESDCKVTSFNGTHVYKTPSTPFQLKTTMLKALSWIHQFKNTTKFTMDCIHTKCNYKDPNSNW